MIITARGYVILIFLYLTFIQFIQKRKLYFKIPQLHHHKTRKIETHKGTDSIFFSQNFDLLNGTA